MEICKSKNVKVSLLSQWNYATEHHEDLFASIIGLFLNISGLKDCFDKDHSYSKEIFQFQHFINTWSALNLWGPNINIRKANIEQEYLQEQEHQDQNLLSRPHLLYKIKET